MHNDLHSGNIFVTKLPKPVRYVYFAKGPSPSSANGNQEIIGYSFETDLLLKIYDFDFASYNYHKVTQILGITHRPQKRKGVADTQANSGDGSTSSLPRQNTKVKEGGYFCLRGMCSSVDWQTDVFRIFSSILRKMGESPSTTILSNWIQKYVLSIDTALDPSLRKRGVLCRSSLSRKNDECEPFRPSAKDLRRPRDILSHAFADSIVFRSSTHAKDKKDEEKAFLSAIRGVPPENVFATPLTQKSPLSAAPLTSIAQLRYDF